MGTSLLWQTDSQLHDAVQRQLEGEPEIDVKAVAITASDGVISLTGFVDSYAQKFSAEQAVKRVRGVRGVANDIHVKVGDERSDLEIARDVLQALQRHTHVPRGITVTVREGCITLEGGVEWNYQRSAAESAVRHLKGVKNVSNAISIHPVASPEQAKVLIEDALKRNADVDAGRVRVHAEGSTITLTGSVTSWVAKYEAERIAWSTPGVGKVENHLIVTP